MVISISSTNRRVGQKPIIFSMPSLELIYVNSPRCACTTTKSLILSQLELEMGIEEDFDSVHSLFSSNLSGEINVYSRLDYAPDYYSFTIVRNPFARVVSFYVGKGGGPISRRVYNYSEGDTFPDFVKKIYQIGTSRFEPHLIEQYRGFRVAQLDKIIRLENYNKEIKEVLNVKDIPQYNASGKKDYRSYYDHESRQMVEELYAKDLEMLNYEF